MRAIELCRTAALGGHLEACGNCSHTRIAYNSCRNRHCPKCQGSAREAWLDERQKDFLPTPYFHVVFTVPATIGAVAFQNKAIVYAILFEAAIWTLKTIAVDRRHLVARSVGSPSCTAGAGAHAPSPYPLPHSRRRIGARRPLDRLPAQLLPAYPCPLASVPPPVHRAACPGA